MRKTNSENLIFLAWPLFGVRRYSKKVQIANRHAKIIIKMYFKHYFYISFIFLFNTLYFWNISTKINLGGVNVILQTVRQIDASQNKAVPDDPVRIGLISELFSNFGPSSPLRTAQDFKA